MQSRWPSVFERMSPLRAAPYQVHPVLLLHRTRDNSAKVALNPRASARSDPVRAPNCIGHIGRAFTNRPHYCKPMHRGNTWNRFGEWIIGNRPPWRTRLQRFLERAIGARTTVRLPACRRCGRIQA